MCRLLYIRDKNVNVYIQHIQCIELSYHIELNIWKWLSSVLYHTQSFKTYLVLNRTYYLLKAAYEYILAICQPKYTKEASGIYVRGDQRSSPTNTKNLTEPSKFNAIPLRSLETHEGLNTPRTCKKGVLGALWVKIIVMCDAKKIPVPLWGVKMFLPHWTQAKQILPPLSAVRK